MNHYALLTAILIIAIMAAEGDAIEFRVPTKSQAPPGIEFRTADKSQGPVVDNSDMSSKKPEEALPIEPAPPNEEGQTNANYKGEPRISYSTPSGYAPVSGEPLLIRKKIIPLDRGMGIGNRLKVVVEITKRDKKREEIEDLDIYEYVDDYLNVISLENGTLIGFDKLKSAEDMGELMDDLYRPDSPYYTRADLREKIFPEGLEPDVIYLPPSNIDPHINKLNWYNISSNDSETKAKFLKLLKDDFGVKWADYESSNISPILHKNNTSIIYINNTQDNTYEQVQILMDNNITDTGTAELRIPDRTTYYLNAENETTKGKDLLWIYDWNGILRLHVNRFSSKDRLFYWYYIKPKKSGIFNIESIIKIRDETWIGWPDIVNHMDIEVSEPDLSFIVTPIMETSRTYAVDEKLNIRYIVYFIGDAANTYKSKINCTIYNATDEYSYIDENGREQKNLKPKLLNFTKGSYDFFHINIKYNKPGLHRIPAIWIEGQLYVLNDNITVKGYLERNKDLFYFLIAIISFSIGLIFNKELKNKLKNIFNSISIKLKGGESKKIDDEYANARDDAAKEMARLIIEALERKEKE